MKEIENKNRKKAQIRKNRGYRARKKSWGQKSESGIFSDGINLFF